MRELKADSFVHSFGNRKILSDIFLTLTTGEIVGLLGRNGSGKSTLLQILFGTFRADQSVIKIDMVYHEKLYRKKLAAYLPQHHFLPNDGTVENVVSLYFNNKADTEKVLSDTNIDMVRLTRVRELSGGTLRFLEVVLTLQLHRPFILLDEPFSGLSPIYHERIKEYMLEAKNDKGILVTDHDYRNIVDISDRLLLLKNGKTLPIENIDELIGYAYLPKRTMK